MWQFIKKKYKKGRYKNSSTVKYMFSLVFLLSLYAVIALVISSNDNKIIISVPATAMEQKKIFPIDIFAEVFEPVNALRLEISISGTADVEVFGIDRGQSVITLWTEDPYVANNIIYLEGGTYRRGFVGKHKIATLQMRALKDGDIQLTVRSVEFLAGDGTGRNVTVGLSPTAKVKIGENVLDNRSRIDINQPIGLRDISIFMADWRSGKSEFDFNNDGKVNFVDFSILLSLALRNN